jgi:FMN-dependent NADH-azoreductase
MGLLVYLKTKKIIIIATRGGIYAGTTKDSQTQYLKDFFAFIGILDITFIYAEGLNMPDSEQRIEAAKTTIENF